MRAHTDSWISINWHTDRRICDAAVRVYARDIDIDYRGRLGFATFLRGDDLSPGRTDATLIEVNPDFDRAGIARLRAVISYDNCSRKARTEIRSFSLALPVLRNNSRPTQGTGLPSQPGGPNQQLPVGQQPPAGQQQPRTPHGQNAAAQGDADKHGKN